MLTVIKKLQERKIFQIDSLIQSTITKHWYGSPVDVKTTLIVKDMKDNHCVCQEYREADGKAYKIRYIPGTLRTMIYLL